MSVRHEVCPRCAFVYLHAEGEGCPRCEREALRTQLADLERSAEQVRADSQESLRRLAAMTKENERLTRERDEAKRLFEASEEVRHDDNDRLCREVDSCRTFWTNRYNAQHGDYTAALARATAAEKALWEAREALRAVLATGVVKANLDRDLRYRSSVALAHADAAGGGTKDDVRRAIANARRACKGMGKP